MKFSVKHKLIGYSCGLGAAFFWGVHSVIIRQLTTEENVSPFLIAGLRLFIGTFTIFVFISLMSLFRRNFKLFKINTDKTFWISAVCLGINFLLFQLGLKYTLASDANIIQNFSPVALLVLGIIFLPDRIYAIIQKREDINKIFRIVILGSIGASLLILNNPKEISLQHGDAKLFGDFIEFIGMFLFAGFVIFQNEFLKRKLDMVPLTITMYTLAAAAIIVLPFMPMKDLFLLSRMQLILIILIGIFSTGVAYVLWSFASRYLEAVPLSLNIMYIGVITVISEILFFDLPLNFMLIAGAGLMIYASVTAEVLQYKKSR